MSAYVTSPPTTPSLTALIGNESEQVPTQGVTAAFDHRVQFYEQDQFLYDAIVDFCGPAFEAGEPVVIVATEPHRAGLRRRLQEKGLDVDRLSASGDVTFLDARATLALFMLDGRPDRDLFRAHVGTLVETLVGRSRTGRVCAYGEMVDLLWREGNSAGTIALEGLWEDLSRETSLRLLCGYSIAAFDHEAHGGDFHRICASHAEVIPTEIYPKDAAASVRLREVSLLQQRARALEGEIQRRKELEHVLRDALAQRQLAEEALRASQQELMDFFENAVEGFHWVGPDGMILAANRAEIEMLGYAKEEYVGHNITEFHVDQVVIADILDRLGRNETIRDYEARLRCKDGSIKHVMIHSNVFFRNGEFIHTRCFTRDITERKRLEGELRRQNEELSRTVRFSEMFVGILGHDLRNPLSAIATAASLLRRRADSDKVAKPATRILSSAARMGRMIDQVLDFTRIRLGKGIPVEQKATDLAEICRLAMDELETMAEGRQIQLDSVGDPVGLWDIDRLAQLVSNLLSNALAHGSGAAPITIRVDGTGVGGVTLEIANSGVVPPEVMPVLFEPFRSGANGKQERSNGLGLGLFISQQIALAHSGTIEVVSSESDGTRFVVRLPRHANRLEPAFKLPGGGG